MSVVSLTTLGQAANKTAPYSLASITGTVYDSGGTSYTIPATKSLVFFRGKRFTLPEYIVTTLGGASFNGPSGVAVAPDGTIYVADYWNNLIRKVTPGGVVTTLAGSGGSGAFSDGTGSGASFYGPAGVAVAPDGSIYVADYSNNRIRKVTNPGDVVTTLAGSGRAEFADGTGAGASFYGPYGVAVAPDGTIYVADYWNNRIRKISLVSSPPSPPANVQLAYTPGATSISVSWNSVLQATSYTVNFYVSGNSTPVQTFTSVISLSQASSFSLLANTTYYASVSANNSLASSAFQQSSNITTAPNSPTGVTMGAYSAGATSISVSWNSVSGATSYTVNFYASGNATPVQTITSVTSLSQASSFTLVANTTYYASISANNATTSSAFQQSSNNITTVAAENTIIFTTDGTAAVNTSTSGFYITSTPNKSTVSLQETLTFTAFNIPYQPGSPYAWFLNTISGASIASNTNPINYQFTSMGNHIIVANVNSFPINGRSINTSVNSLAFTVISLYNNSKTFESIGNPTIKLTNANSTPIWINVSGPQNLGITINSTQFTITSSGQISIYISNPSSVNTITITNNTSTLITVTITNSSQYSSTATY